MTMQVSQAQLKVYRATAQKRETAHKIQLEERRERAWMLAHRAAGILKEEFGVSRVVVFGSLLQPNRFHLSSDIDLAIWDGRDYFRAVSRLMDLDPEFEFDLVPIEDARTEIVAAINRDGKDL